jgi:large subunit ribosomal protein L4
MVKTKTTKVTAKKPVKPVKTVKTAKAVKAVSVAAPSVQAVEYGKDVVYSVVNADGKAAGTISLPSALFAVKMNRQLVAQAIRVYLANQREGSAATKTRGQVEGSTRKIYKQKGTGRARHGGIRAPIFVGGGVAFGPQPQDYRLSFPDKMRRLALSCVLTQKVEAKQLVVVDGLENLPVKTKNMAQALTVVAGNGKKLLAIPNGSQVIGRSARNIQGVHIVSASSLSTYDVYTHPTVVITKEALVNLKKSLGKV